MKQASPSPRLAALLERIGYDDRTDATIDTLRGLQAAFLLAVPFENLDVHLTRHIEFTPESVYRKVVEQRRGGFCYELNSLFHDLLGTLGFDVRFLAARMIRDGRPGTVMGHMVLRVDLDGHTWLTDVGNGKSAREPLNVDGSNECWAEGVGYRVRRTDTGPVLFETDADHEWHPRFMFELEPRRREEFVPVCEWTQSSPDSRFTQHRICTLARPNGRLLLLDNKLTITEGIRTEEREIPESEYRDCLRSLFNIIL